jgi:hypothetical protein
MTLVVAGSFGSLSEATIVFSRLSAAGFNPVAAFNMNTPGVAGGMAPSAYRVLLPEAEVLEAHRFMSDLAHSPTDDHGGGDDRLDQTDELADFADTRLSRLRPVVRRLILALFVTWLGLAWLAWRCSGVSREVERPTGPTRAGDEETI